MKTKIDPETICICPKCNKRLWRVGHRIDGIFVTQGIGDRSLACCMHCSAMLVLEGTKWRDPTNAEFTEVSGFLMPIAKVYHTNRICAALLGLELEEFLEFYEEYKDKTKLDS